MKWITLALFATLAIAPFRASAQEVLPIGNIYKIEDTRPATWAISGYEIFHVRTAVNGLTPYTRAAVCDARLVEILSRTQEPPLRAKDIRVMTRNGRHFIVVRRYLLFEVQPQDARAEHTSLTSLADRWAASARRALPQIAPMPSRFGI